MTRDEAVSLIQQQLSFRTDQSTNVVTYLQLAQQTLEKSPALPWWLKSERSTIATTSGEQRIQVPSDFLREDDDSQLAYIPTSTDSDIVHLKKDSVAELEAMYQRTTGAPEAYALDGMYFRIFPTPDAAYTIRMVYFKRDTVLTTNVENKWLQHLPYLLMGVAGGMMASALRDKTAQATFQGWAAEGYKLLLTENVARETANMDMQIGGPH